MASATSNEPASQIKSMSSIGRRSNDVVAGIIDVPVCGGEQSRNRLSPPFGPLDTRRVEIPRASA